MEIVIPGIVILILLLTIYVRIKNQQKLLEKAQFYEASLQNSRVTRRKYFHCMEKSRKTFKEYEQISNELEVMKAELLEIRSDIRDELRFLRAEAEKSTGTDLDKRTITQMKAEFGEKWKLFSSSKTNYNKNLDKLLETKKMTEQATQEEIEAASKWSEEKEKIMNLWRELTAKIQITDPNEYLAERD